MNSSVSVIILAAGKSTRMGTQKLCMQLGQHTMLEQTVDNYLASKVNDVIVVIGHEAPNIKKLLPHKTVSIVHNPRYEEGIGTSISAGIKTVKDDMQSVVIALADQPYVRSDTIDYIIDEHRKNNKGISVPVYKGIRGNPAIFDIKYKEDLLTLEGDTGGKQITSRYPDDVFEIAIESEEVIADIDTIESYHKVKRKFEKRTTPVNSGSSRIMEQ